jgi:hypothetical protein
MDTLSIFKLVVGGASALASVYAVGRMVYVAATAPTNVRRASVVVNYEIVTLANYGGAGEFEIYVQKAAKSLNLNSAESQEPLPRHLRKKGEHQAV